MNNNSENEQNAKRSAGSQSGAQRSARRTPQRIASIPESSRPSADTDATRSFSAIRQDPPKSRPRRMPMTDFDAPYEKKESSPAPAADDDIIITKRRSVSSAERAKFEALTKADAAQKSSAQRPASGTTARSSQPRPQKSAARDVRHPDPAPAQNMTPRTPTQTRPAGTPTQRQNPQTPAQNRAVSPAANRTASPTQNHPSAEHRPQRVSEAPDRSTAKPKFTDKIKNVFASVISPKRPQKAGSKYAATNDFDDDDSYFESENTSAVSGALKAIIYIMCVLLVSGLLSYYAIGAGNDVFAFTKKDVNVTISIDENTSLGKLASILKKNDVISHPNLFKLYAHLRKTKCEFVAGTYEITSAMSFDKLLQMFNGTTKSTYVQVKVTIPEGYTVDDIIKLFVDKGIGTREGFIDAIQNYDYDYWFVKEIDQSASPNRKYRLEGYLYPDTYYINTAWGDGHEEKIIMKILDNFDNKIKENFGGYYEDLCKRYKMSFDQIITLASMIQMESKFEDEYEDVSEVFHNRLSHPSETNGKLESDATIQYILDKRTEHLTSDQLKIDNPYNTRIYAGLPPGPITNPTINAINYAFFPGNNGYYYFVAQSNGRSLFAKTYEEHLKNIEIANAAQE